MGGRIAIFAHYDRDDEIKPYVVQHLSRLRDVVDKVLLYSTSSLPADTQESVKAFVDSLVCLDNRGFDFGMWRSALERIDLDMLDELVLTNSSVMGPLKPLPEVFEHMSQRQCDFWGMTESYELRWHIQTYFLVFRAAALRSSCFREFFTGVLPYRDKTQVILSYELGLSTYLVENGLKPSVWVDASTLWADPRAQRRGVEAGVLSLSNCPLNPTIFLPDILIERGMPYVKVETVRDNPAGIELQEVRSALMVGRNT